MKKIFHLASCSTCQRIIKDLGIGSDFDMQNIKEEPITLAQLAMMAEKTGSYESLFSRRAMKYRERGLQHKTLNEMDYQQLILEEYTFLKRPVILIDEEIFVGSGKKAIEAARSALNK